MKKTILLLLLALYSVAPFAAEPIKVACIGNSITYGAGVENRETNSYPSVLGRKLGEKYLVDNFGRSGATLLRNGHNPYTKTKEWAAAKAFAPDVAIVHLGVNDTDPRNFPRFREQFIPDYLALIDTLRQLNPKVRVIVTQMSPIFHNHQRFKAGTRDWFLLIQKEIAQVAQQSGAELISFHEVLYHRIDLVPDAVHPNAQGAALLADRAYAAITGNFGGLALNELYTDNMVLQRSEATAIFGRGNAGKKVTVALDGKKYTTTVDGNGHWRVTPALRQAKNGLTLKVASDGVSKVFSNVAIGELWILSGQSNMSWPVAKSTAPENARANPLIRLFLTAPMFAEQDSLTGVQLAELNSLDYSRNPTWKVATKEDIKNFSGVGYYFAQMLSDSLAGVAIGLVQTSLGGAPAEAFVERSVLENSPWIDDILYDWQKNPMVDAWVRSVVVKTLKGATVKGQRHYFEPAYLYESRIAPLEGTTAKGVLWYQGESNADNAELHERLFPAVVSSFRTAFDNPNLPFYFVQLADCARPSWPHFRESQRKLAQRIENCEMVVSMDYGDPNDVHPRRKQPIGERLARVALANLYR